ncbi:hypothetical protein JKP88DRAFT_274345 [Tribonema minus]|uniref:Uncharacterized protein n=1 Tax=Tribonema minus TaxID=303371 RepID=A0A835YJZ0_9STRA|nr:hypothetical protein JKP88DRAFT_274345 [Tribonema minus]
MPTPYQHALALMYERKVVLKADIALGATALQLMLFVTRAAAAAVTRLVLRGQLVDLARYSADAVARFNRVSESKLQLVLDIDNTLIDSFAGPEMTK